MRPWTEAHRREALSCALRIAADLIRSSNGIDRATARALMIGVSWCKSEATFRRHMSFGIDPARIDREVRRVRALAEGRLVREIGWYVHDGRGERRDATDYAHAVRLLDIGRRAESAGAPGRSRIVRVTRIRRPS